MQKTNPGRTLYRCPACGFQDKMNNFHQDGTAYRCPHPRCKAVGIRVPSKDSRVNHHKKETA